MPALACALVDLPGRESATLDSAGNPQGWSPSPRPTRFDTDSALSSDECMVTPPSDISTPVADCSGRRQDKSARDLHLEQSNSASRVLKEFRSMKRTPQPNLTQSKLTSMLQHQPAPTIAAPVAAKTTNARGDIPELPGSPTDMDTTPAAAKTGTNPGSNLVTTDFLLKSLKENTDHIIKAFTTNLGMLSQRVDGNSALISENKEELARQKVAVDRHNTEISGLAARVSELERSGLPQASAVQRRVELSEEYTWARRSIRVWPVPGNSEAAMWEGVGDFIHETLKISTDDLGQDDIESVQRVLDAGATGVKEEVIVTFFDKKKRDIIPGSAQSLSRHIDREGRPTAGIRLEIPPELQDSFRLLTRFGTRLRARHGAGTRRHIKFDDFTGTLFSNVKLPGDESWNRVTPEMARDDLDASQKEENAATRKRLAAKLVPGPRERLSRPVPPARQPPRPALTAAASEPSGKRPRWSVPDRVR